MVPRHVPGWTVATILNDTLVPHRVLRGAVAAISNYTVVYHRVLREASVTAAISKDFSRVLFRMTWTLRMTNCNFHSVSEVASPSSLQLNRQTLQLARPPMLPQIGTMKHTLLQGGCSSWAALGCFRVWLPLIHPRSLKGCTLYQRCWRLGRQAWLVWAQQRSLTTGDEIKDHFP
jgi:hypothetical protein